MHTIDYHTHTSYSADSDAPMEDMIRQAVSLGITEMAITDHVDYMYPIAPYPFQIDYDEYMVTFNRLREAYADRIRLTFGVEIGMGAHLADTVREFVARYPFEFIIGSIHDVQGEEFHLEPYWQGRTTREGYMRYFEEMLESVRNIDEICVVGHIDYIMRYCPYADKALRYADYSEMIDEILKEVISREKGIEINTSGFRYKLDMVHPQMEILKRYKALGGEIITVGSDAHAPRFIYERFDAAYDALREAGFKAIAVYRGRKPVMLDI